MGCKSRISNSLKTEIFIDRLFAKLNFQEQSRQAQQTSKLFTLLLQVQMKTNNLPKPSLKLQNRIENYTFHVDL